MSSPDNGATLDFAKFIEVWISAFIYRAAILTAFYLGVKLGLAY
jgi:hypothetical protein